jgi:hypothetical protein
MNMLQGPKNFLTTLKDTGKRRGFFFILYHFPEAVYYTYFKKTPKTFIFQGAPYNYFYHLYNYTHLNERAVEIPIVREIARAYQGKRILEIGNVLSHYFSYQHDTLDKYEKGENIINQDVVDFQPQEKYDLILSISTLEHVGWDENVKNPEKILLAIQNLKKHLVSGGKMVITLPLGYNSELDKLLEENKIDFTDQHYFKKVQSNNEWKQVKRDEVLRINYDNSLHSANGLFIGIIQTR